MSSDRNNQKQIWADIEFVKKLEDLRAKRVLVGKPVKNVGELTKEIAKSDAFKLLEDDILNFDPFKKPKNNVNVRIKFDGLFR